MEAQGNRPATRLAERELLPVLGCTCAGEGLDHQGVRLGRGLDVGKLDLLALDPQATSEMLRDEVGHRGGQGDRAARPGCLNLYVGIGKAREWSAKRTIGFFLKAPLREAP